MKSREYFRGCYHGYAAAMELLTKYGQAFVLDHATKLQANLRKRSESHTDFDYGYVHAYRAVAEDGQVPFTAANELSKYQKEG